MNILVTNDDGIDSKGLHVLARAINEIGDVTIVAPDREFSGAGCSIGALHLQRPDIHDAHVEGINKSWSVSGPPALCVMFARLGAFDVDFDLIVSGINPGANVGRAVYMSGTVGACLSGRMGGLSGIAISQQTEGWGVLGQGYEEMLESQKWETAAAIAAVAAKDMLASPPAEAQILNINVPNVDLADVKGVRKTTVGNAPPRKMSTVKLEPKPGHAGSYNIDMNWGEPSKDEVDDTTDVGAVMHGFASVTALGHLMETELADDAGPLVAIETLIS